MRKLQMCLCMLLGAGALTLLAPTAAMAAAPTSGRMHGVQASIKMHGIHMRGIQASTRWHGTRMHGSKMHNVKMHGLKVSTTVKPAGFHMR